MEIVICDVSGISYGIHHKEDEVKSAVSNGHRRSHSEGQLGLRWWALVGMIIGAASLRFLPHPPNFSPIAAMALFAGAHITRRDQALVLPLAAMFLSDLFLGLHSTMWAVYGSIALVSAMSFVLRPQNGLARLGFATLSSSVVFFLITNFAVWLQEGMYEKTWSGLVAAYIAALPFFQNSLAGDFFFVSIVFGAWFLVEKAIPELRRA